MKDKKSTQIIRQTSKYLLHSFNVLVIIVGKVQSSHSIKKAFYLVIRSTEVFIENILKQVFNG